MKRIVLAYGLLGGLLIATLKLVEYRFLVLEHSLEICGGIVAVIFVSLGIWLGLKLTKTREVVVVREIPVVASGPFKRNDARLEQLGMTPRELEILEAMAPASAIMSEELTETAIVSFGSVTSHWRPAAIASPMGEAARMRLAGAFRPKAGAPRCRPRLVKARRPRGRARGRAPTDRSTRAPSRT